MKNALLISVQGIGNTVLMTPVIKSLAEAGYEVDTLVSDNGSDEILTRNPNANRQYLWIENEGLIRNVVRLSQSCGAFSTMWPMRCIRTANERIFAYLARHPGKFAMLIPSIIIDCSISSRQQEGYV